MKFIAAADIHIHSKVPENRKGDYFGQVTDKFQKLLDITVKHSDDKLLVVAGDFFDSSTVAYKVTQKIMEMLMDNEVHLLVVPGQHDLRYHVGELKNTPLGILATCDLVSILNPRNRYTIKDVSFVGAGWNEEPETEADVLVMHRMITKKGELWPGQTNYSSAHAILRKYPWAKCIISGDNHAPHTLKSNGKLQINCGSMVRSTKSQVGFQPRVHLIDTNSCNTWTTTSIKIPCLPDDEVFDFSKIAIEELKGEAKKEAEKKIAEFINTLPVTAKEKPNFKTILNNVVAHVDPKKSVRTIIDNIMEEVSC